ncbi:MAG: S-layer homology domain-containing protein [Acidimicrobiia bacterium]|nr:S-layer homology domain-containing protein [Acidimicrobiia bacterium]
MIRFTGNLSGVTVNSANLTINDDDDPVMPNTVRLSVSPNSISESATGNARNVTVRATIVGTARFTTNQTVTVSASRDSGTVGFDPIPNFNITIAAGAASGTATVTITPDNDTVDETDAVIRFTGNLSGVTVNSANLTVTDDEPTTTTTTTGGSVGGSGVFDPPNPPDEIDDITDEEPALVLSDVPQDAWYGVAVLRLVEMGVVTGYPDGTYRPDNGITRAQMAALLSRALGGAPTEPSDTETPGFSDVPEDAWYGSAVRHIASLGVTQGCGDGGSYCPDSVVTRAQMALFLQRAYNFEPPDNAGPSFEDVGADHYAYEAVESLLAARITTGCRSEPALFCPDGVVTRAQTAVFLIRYLDRSGG